MVLISLLFSFFVVAQDQNNIYLGEKNFGHYYDTFSPEIIETKALNHIRMKHQEDSSLYLAQFISRDLFFDKKDIFKDLMNYSSCSNEDLSIGKEYFRYSHRLLSLSYLYEAVSRYDYTQKLLGFSNNCKQRLKDNIKTCRPRSRDMQSFINNLKIYTKYEKKKYVNANYSIKKFKAEFLSTDSSLNNLLKYRMKVKGTKNTLTGYIDSVCSEDVKLFSLICNENDSLYGMSRIYETYPLLVRSNVFNYFVDKINTVGCLKRYKKEMTYLEKKYPSLNQLFPFIYQELKGHVNNAGDIFKLGTLREFNEQGLSLYKQKIGLEKPKKKKDKVIKRKAIKKKKNEKKIKKIAIENSKEEISPKKVEIPKVQISEFLKTKRYLNKNKLSSLILNMDEFKYDYLINLKLKNRLDNRLAKFFTRSSLIEMKRIDSFGSKKSPLPLIFLKYMIDYNKHKELFTLIDVIGSTFYVKNDIDKDDEIPISKIQLENNFQTQFKWQIFLKM